MSEFYPRIVNILKEKNISINEFAKLLEIPRSTLSSWLNGVYEPPLAMIRKTAIILDISVDEIILELPKKKQ